MMKVRFFGIVAALAFAATLGVLAQQTGVVAPSDVHPISGRRFAQVMSAAGAAWLDRPERIEEEEPDRALDVLKIPERRRGRGRRRRVGLFHGEVVFTRRARRARCTPYDIQPEMLRLLGLRLTKAATSPT